MPQLHTMQQPNYPMYHPPVVYQPPSQIFINAPNHAITTPPQPP